MLTGPARPAATRTAPRALWVACGGRAVQLGAQDAAAAMPLGTGVVCRQLCLIWVFDGPVTCRCAGVCHRTRQIATNVVTGAPVAVRVETSGRRADRRGNTPRCHLAAWSG
jgi:hypothetical protein